MPQWSPSEDLPPDASDPDLDDFLEEVREAEERELRSILGDDGPDGGAVREPRRPKPDSGDGSLALGEDS